MRCNGMVLDPVEGKRLKSGYKEGFSDAYRVSSGGSSLTPGDYKIEEEQPERIITNVVNLLGE
jgi:hypothetical protein